MQLSVGHIRAFADGLAAGAMGETCVRERLRLLMLTAFGLLWNEDTDHPPDYNME